MDPRGRTGNRVEHRQGLFRGSRSFGSEEAEALRPGKLPWELPFEG